MCHQERIQEGEASLPPAVSRSAARLVRWAKGCLSVCLLISLSVNLSVCLIYILFSQCLVMID